jgi:hypothetical protein
MKIGPCRRNPEGARWLGATPLLRLLGEEPTSTLRRRAADSPPSTLARDPSHYSDGLLACPDRSDRVTEATDRRLSRGPPHRPNPSHLSEKKATHLRKIEA